MNDYDGIQTGSTHPPAWWHLAFLTTILFSLCYLTYWHANPDAVDIEESWRRAQVADFTRIFGAVGQLQPDQPTILKMMHDEPMLAVARTMFIANCANCHGKDGAGMSGSACVNLTDDHWKNVKNLTDIFTVITKGANTGAMPPWEARLSINERVILAAYVATLREQPLPGRTPEGEVIPPWPK